MQTGADPPSPICIRQDKLDSKSGLSNTRTYQIICFINSSGNSSKLAGSLRNDEQAEVFDQQMSASEVGRRAVYPRAEF